MEKISFMPDGENAVDFYVLEQTTITGINYLLVTDADEDDVGGEAYILIDITEGDSEERVYTMVEDDNEFEAVAKVFDSMLDDVDLIQRVIEKGLEIIIETKK